MVLMPDSDGESLTPAGGTAIAERPVDEVLAQTPWVTIVWDDPVNLMSYVTHVFVSYFHYTKSKAEKLMLQVHTTGKAIVSSGPREAMGARRHRHARIRPMGNPRQVGQVMSACGGIKSDRAPLSWTSERAASPLTRLQFCGTAGRE